MDRKLAIILAVDEDSELAFAKHDRCAAWASDQGWLIRKRLIIHGADARDPEGVRQAILAAVNPMTADALLSESLSELNQSPFDLAALLEHLPTKSVVLHTLKEAPDGGAATWPIALMGAFCPLDARTAVYAGPKNALDDAKRHAASLGWDLLVPRSKRLRDQLKSAPERLLYVPSLAVLDALDASRAGRARQIADLFEARRVFIADVGLDSAAPSAQACLLALLSTTPVAPAVPAQAPARLVQSRATSADRPTSAELLTQWAGRKRGAIDGSITAYIHASGYSTSAFFGHLHAAAATLKAALEQRLAGLDRSAPRADDYAAVAQQFALDPADVEFTVRWSNESGKRSHSTGNTNQL